MFCHFSSGLYISVNKGHKIFIFCVIEEPIDTQFLIHVNPTSAASLSIRRFWGERGKMEAKRERAERERESSSPSPLSPI